MPETPIRGEQLEADVVIVGAGPAGLACAVSGVKAGRGFSPDIGASSS